MKLFFVFFVSLFLAFFFFNFFLAKYLQHMRGEGRVERDEGCCLLSSFLFFLFLSFSLFLFSLFFLFLFFSNFLGMKAVASCHHFTFQLFHEISDIPVFFLQICLLNSDCFPKYFAFWSFFLSPHFPHLKGCKRFKWRSYRRIVQVIEEKTIFQCCTLWSYLTTCCTSPL